MTEPRGTITIRPDGPYRVEGEVPLEGPNGALYEPKPAYSLCRCGKSSNKPYCDGTHKECGFVGTEIGSPPAGALDAGEIDAASRIRVVRDGPYHVFGAPTLTSSDGRTWEAQTFYRLCRCGASKNKPFCDDSHVEVGFHG